MQRYFLNFLYKIVCKTHSLMNDNALVFYTCMFQLYSNILIYYFIVSSEIVLVLYVPIC